MPRRVYAQLTNHPALLLVGAIVKRSRRTTFVLMHSSLTWQQAREIVAPQLDDDEHAIIVDAYALPIELRRDELVLPVELGTQPIFVPDELLPPWVPRRRVVS